MTVVEPSLTFIYIVEPPTYEVMACTLLATIREFFPPGVRAVGYCPAHRMAELSPSVLRAHAMMGAEVRPMGTEARWDTPYPHGNKILACLEPRDTDFTAFVDSDVAFLRPNRPETLVREGHVSCSVAASMQWGGQEVWPRIWGAFGLDVPGERVDLMRRGTSVAPYFSAGLVVFPEAAGPGGRFPEVWYDSARAVDRIGGLDGRRPYLDQMSLPVAIRRSGLNWNILPEEQHYILGGKIKGEKLPEDREIFTVHYRNFDNLRHAGLRKATKSVLERHLGVPYVGRLTGAEVSE